MKRLTIVSLAAGLLLSQTSQAAAPKAPACPSAEFPAFFAAYADSAAMQKAFTVYPLAHVLLDHAAQPQPREIKVQLAKAKLSFPLIPPRADRKRAGLAFRTDEVSGDRARVSLFKEETGYRVVYNFRKDGCWKLEGKEDRSL
ncbi:MAG: hypothetical protein V4631_08305 [Pseudomonadota bacterium]